MGRQFAINVSREVKDELNKKRVDGRFVSHDELQRSMLGLGQLRPLVGEAGSSESTGRSYKWPFAEMQVGDVRIVPWEYINENGGIAKASHALSGIKHRSGRDFAVTAGADGWNIVRTS